MGPINKAAYVFAEVILSHPYMDGNGRLARSLALACLAKEMGGKMPLLPLGAAFYARARRTASALQTLAVTANWPYFMDAFEALLTDALFLAESILFHAKAPGLRETRVSEQRVSGTLSHLEPDD